MNTGCLTLRQALGDLSSRCGGCQNAAGNCTADNIVQSHLCEMMIQDFPLVFFTSQNGIQNELPDCVGVYIIHVTPHHHFMDIYQVYFIGKISAKWPAMTGQPGDLKYPYFFRQ